MIWLIYEKRKGNCLERLRRRRRHGVFGVWRFCCISEANMKLIAAVVMVGLALIASGVLVQALINR